MPIIPYLEHTPSVHSSVFVAPNAWITGRCTLGKDCSLFFGATLRGDIQAIIIGEGTNLQEHVIVHTSRGLKDCVIGNFVTVGHGAILHGCQTQDECLIGMGSTILNNAVIEKHAIIGAHSLVPMGMVVPEGHLAYGVPAKVVRPLTEKERAAHRISAEHYIKVGQNYKKELP